MAGLSWIAVLLTFSLSVGNNQAVDQNYLTRSVDQIMNRYRIDGVQSCFAVNIPEDQKKFEEIFKNDEPHKVTTKYGGGDMYKGTNVVAAKKLEGEKSGKPFTEHAEARVLDNIEGLTERSAGHSLIIYSSLSPCHDKCTNRNNYFNILDKIENNVINKWTDYAFVFTTVFDKTSLNKPIPLANIKEALTNLASAIGQNNIFACYKPWNSAFKCVKCYNNGVVEEECIKN